MLQNVQHEDHVEAGRDEWQPFAVRAREQSESALAAVCQRQRRVVHAHRARTFLEMREHRPGPAADVEYPQAPRVEHFPEEHSDQEAFADEPPVVVLDLVHLLDRSRFHQRGRAGST